MMESVGIEKIQETRRLLVSNFPMGWYSIIPPLVILIMALMKISIVYCMGAGLISSMVIIFVLLNPSLIDMVRLLVLGYQPLDPQIAHLISGGGLLSMKNVIIIIGVSTALNGLMEDLSMLEAIKLWYLKGIKHIGGLIYKTALLSFVMAAITCNQSLAIIIPGRFMKDEFQKRNIPSKTLARTIADTGSVMVPLIPWNVNAVAAVLILGVSTITYMPFAILCYILPAITLIYGYLGFNKRVDKNLVLESNN